MEKLELDDFYNEGFGWTCKHCEREIKEQNKDFSQKHSRLMREGETESKHLKLANPASAKWADKEQRTLMCPRCGITESADKS